MGRMIISTVGLSLLTGREGDRPWTWSPRNPSPLPDRQVIANWLASADPEVASAETNTLRLLEIGERDRLVLLPTDTPPCRLCSGVFAELYKGRCRDVAEDPISHLGYSAEHFRKGLRELLDKAIHHSRRAEKENTQPVIAASGGFKAEIAFLSLLGALMNVEVHYVHEQHRSLVTLPRLPLDWDTGFVVSNREFFEWIDEEPRPSREVESRLKRCPELEPLVEADGGGIMTLTVAGDLLFKAAKAVEGREASVSWPPCCELHPSEKNKVSNVSHHRPGGWESTVVTICEIRYVTKVAYDPRAHGSEPVHIMDDDKGTIGVVIDKRGKNPLPLVVETTARGGEQTRLLVDFIRRTLKF